MLEDLDQAVFEDGDGYSHPRVVNGDPRLIGYHDNWVDQVGDDLGRLRRPHPRVSYDDNWVDQVGHDVDGHQMGAKPPRHGGDVYHIDYRGRPYPHSYYNDYPDGPVREAVRGASYTGRTAVRDSARVADDVTIGSLRAADDAVRLRPLQAVGDVVAGVAGAAMDVVKAAVDIPAAAVSAAISTTASVGEKTIELGEGVDHSHYAFHMFGDDACLRDDDGSCAIELPVVSARAKEASVEPPSFSLCPRQSDCLGCGQCMQSAGGKASAGKEGGVSGSSSSSNSAKKACGCANCVARRDYKNEVKKFEELKLSGAKAEAENSASAAPVEKPAIKAKACQGKRSRGHHAGCDCPSCLGRHREGCLCPRCVACDCEACASGRIGYPPAGPKYLEHRRSGCHSSKCSKNSSGQMEQEPIVMYDPPLAGGKTFCCNQVPDPTKDTCPCAKTERVPLPLSQISYGRENYDEQGTGQRGLSFSHYSPPLSGGKCSFCKKPPVLGRDCDNCKQTIYDPPGL